jgi:hypothetical protein
MHIDAAARRGTRSRCSTLPERAGRIKKHTRRSDRQ